MRFDVYIKVVLTIIALSLTLGWVRNINFAYPVHAESGMEQAEIYAGVGEDERVQLVFKDCQRGRQLPDG